MYYTNLDVFETMRDAITTQRRNIKETNGSSAREILCLFVSISHNLLAPPKMEIG